MIKSSPWPWKGSLPNLLGSIEKYWLGILWFKNLVETTHYLNALVKLQRSQVYTFNEVMEYLLPKWMISNLVWNILLGKNRNKKTLNVTKIKNQRVSVRFLFEYQKASKSSP